jgi:hypothetical protein
MLLKVPLHEIFSFGFLHWSNIYRPNKKVFQFFRFGSWILQLFWIFNLLRETQLRRSLIPRQLSQHQVRRQLEWINTEWDSRSTESTRNDEIFVNVGAFCVDSVDVESPSALDQLTRSLTPRWLSWQGVSLLVDSVCGRWVKPKHAHTTNSGAFKEIGFRKINHEMFKSDPYQPENAKSFNVAWSKKLTLRLLSWHRVMNNSNILANSIFYIQNKFRKRIRGSGGYFWWKNRSKKSHASIPLIHVTCSLQTIFTYNFFISNTIGEYQKLLALALQRYSDNATLHCVLLCSALAQWRKVIACKLYHF